MARTLHQAMAYLGLAENESERAQQSSRRLEPVYEETVFEADDSYETFDEESAYTRGQAPAASDRDVLLGLQSEPHSQTAETQASVAQAADSFPYEEPEYRAPNREPESFLHEEQYLTAPQAAQPTSPFTTDESDEELRRITTIHPRSYNDAKIIGESFRENIPVIMNVTDMGDTDAKRLVDFSAGLAFALHGSIERVTDKVFLLTPANLEVLGAEGTETPVALDSDDSGLFNQG